MFVKPRCREHSVVRHCKDTVGLGLGLVAGTLCSGTARTLGLGEMLWGLALQLGTIRTRGLVTAESLWCRNTVGCALQGHSGVGQHRRTRRVWHLKI